MLEREEKAQFSEGTAEAPAALVSLFCIMLSFQQPHSRNSMEYTVHSLQSPNLKDLYTQTYTIHFSVKKTSFFVALFVLAFVPVEALLKSNFSEGSDYKSSRWSSL